MSAVPFTRPPAREAGPELLLLQKWEETAGWLVEHTAKWPKSARFSLVQKVDNHALDVLCTRAVRASRGGRVQKVDNHALDVLEMLIVARYEPARRRKLLRAVNLRLERLRFLLRVARARRVMPAQGFETAQRGIDEVGRMVHGWRVAISERAPREEAVASGADA